jgi:DNA gyrase subunit A
MKNTVETDLVSQVKADYLDYSIATLSRALPDIFDGLIPARRRLLQTMLEEGLLPSKPYVKCARTTGLTSAFYHPHGSCYSSLISMATSWNNTIPWIDCHGNVGSTVDSPAAERYVENRLTTAALEILLANRETWETRPNYDGSRQEAVRLDSRIPTVLLNGTEGISVGYSTKIPQHNLRDIVNSVVTGETLYPDFPTGCHIIRDEGLNEYVKTGSGTLRTRAVVEFGTQEKSGRAKERATLTFTCLSPNTNPEKIGQQIKDSLEKGKFEGVSEVIDLSDLSGDRIQVVAKPGVETSTLAKNLWHYTDLESTYSARNLCLAGPRPTELSSSEIITEWRKWRVERLRVQFVHEQDLKMQRLEVVMGFIKATDRIDEIIKTIKASSSKKEALIALVDRPFKFTRDQADAILEMKLRQLTGLDIAEMTVEKEELEARLAVLETLIESEPKRTKFMLDEVKKIGVRYGEARRSQLIAAPDSFIARQSGQTRAATTPKPRFMKVDLKKGVVEQVRGPRGAMVVDSKEKVIFMTNDGVLKKVPATFKGPIGTGYSEVVLAKRETEVAQRNYLVVFSLEGQLKAMTLKGEDLCKTTSKGKRYLPEGAELVYFGETSYVVPWVSTRKKKVELFPIKVKQGRPGGKGTKVADLSEVSLVSG